MGNKSSLFLRHEEIAQIQNETGCKLLQSAGETPKQRVTLKRKPTTIIVEILLKTNTQLRVAYSFNVNNNISQSVANVH